MFCLLSTLRNLKLNLKLTNFHLNPVRPTEIAESDIYICESVFDEAKKQIRKVQTPEMLLRKFQHTQLVTPDEIYHYKRPLIVVRGHEPIVLIDHKDEFKTEGGDYLGITEDSLDGGHSSVGSDFISTPTVHTHLLNSAKKKNKKQVVTGYILYSREMRKTFVSSNPEAKFGDISRIVGNEWRSLVPNDRQVWEEKATKYNEETARRKEEMEASSPSAAEQVHPHQLYECCWDKCDWQFEDSQDCYDHAVAEGTGHVQTYCATAVDVDYICMWRGCIRLKKQAPAFPSVNRLVKHVRDVHINKCNGRRIVPPGDRSK